MPLLLRQAGGIRSALLWFTGVELIIGSKVLCMLCFEICTPEGRGGEKGGSVNFKAKHTEPLTQEIPVYIRINKVVKPHNEPAAGKSG